MENKTNSLMKIEGGHLLHGNVQVSGSKNASLPIIAAALLAPGKNTLLSAPKIGDVNVLNTILEGMNVQVWWEGNSLTIDTTSVSPQNVDVDLGRRMRASILLLGPLLARFGKAKLALPGGCAIGTRDVGQHIDGLRQLGARVAVRAGQITAHPPPGSLHGSFTFKTLTVTGTENLMLASALGGKVTHLYNAAQEPEIVDLAAVLQQMGV